VNIKDDNGNYIPWTNRPSKKDRIFGGRFSVNHSSASAWYVFDNLFDRVAKDGMYREDAFRYAKMLARSNEE